MDKHWVPDERAMKMLSYMLLLEERTRAYAQDAAKDLQATKKLVSDELEKNAIRLLKVKNECLDLEAIGKEFYSYAEKQLLATEAAPESHGEQ